MINKYTLPLLPFFLLMFAFSSCISIERTIKINDDGSGKETTTIVYSKAFFDFMIGSANAFDSVKGSSIIDSIYNEKNYSDEIKEKYKDIKGIKLNEVKSKLNPDSSLTLKIKYSFDKIENITSNFRALEEEQGDFSNGKTEISFKKDGKKYNFRYKYNASEESDSAKSIRNSLSGFFSGQKMIFNITFPYNISKSNASKTNGKTLSWEFDMDKMMSDMNIIDLKAELKK